MYLSRSLQKPLVILGQAFVATSSPRPFFKGLPSALKTSTAIPSAGPPTVQDLSGMIGRGERKHAPTSVPPDMLMIGHLFRPIFSKYHFQGSGFQGSPVEPRIRSDERSCLSI